MCTLLHAHAGKWLQVFWGSRQTRFSRVSFKNKYFPDLTFDVQPISTTNFLLKKRNKKIDVIVILALQVVRKANIWDQYVGLYIHFAYFNILIIEGRAFCPFQNFNGLRLILKDIPALEFAFVNSKTFKDFQGRFRSGIRFCHFKDLPGSPRNF